MFDECLHFVMCDMKWENKELYKAILQFYSRVFNCNTDSVVLYYITWYGICMYHMDAQHKEVHNIEHTFHRFLGFFLILVYLLMLWDNKIIYLQMVGWLLNNELIRMLKETIMVSLRNCPNICVQIQWEATWCSLQGQNVNLGLSEYNAKSTAYSTVMFHFLEHSVKKMSANPIAFY
jgi:hypothetical protein